MVPTRRMSFEESLRDLPKHFAGDGDLIASHVIAALSSVFPDGEDFFVRSVRHYRDQITDPDAQAPGRRLHRPGGHARPRAPGLQRPPRRARLPDQASRAVHQVGPGDPRADPAGQVEPGRHRRARALHRHAGRARPHRARRPATCSAHDAVRDLFLWHALEESEHKAVAFDVYKAVGGSERHAGLHDELLPLRLRRRAWRLRLSCSRCSATATPTGAATCARAGGGSEGLADHGPGAVAPAARTTTDPTSTPTTATPPSWSSSWRAELFGEHGTLNDKLRPAAARLDCGRWRNVSTAREHLDVLIVGAGLSGIGAGHYLQTECPWATYAIFEARDAIGGTWDLFRYPGIRSDSDMFTLGYSFRPWDGEKSIADGDSILQYIKDTAAEAGIDDQIRFNHRIVARRLVDRRRALARHRRAHRHRRDGRAHVRLRLLAAAATTATTTATSPTSPGMDRLRRARSSTRRPGPRTSTTPASGSSSSAAAPPPSRWCPSLAEHGRARDDAAALADATSRRCRRRTRSPTLLRTVLPAHVGRHRRSAGSTRSATQALLPAEPAAARSWCKRVLRKGVERQLPAGYDVDTHFTPTYDPWDQRLCVVPDGDLFAAIRDGIGVGGHRPHRDASPRRACASQSGAELEADVIVTATGPRAAVPRRHRRSPSTARRSTWPTS